MSSAPVAMDPSAPILFLLGPLGVGKSTFGRRACTELNLTFLDFVDVRGAIDKGGEARSDLEQLTSIVLDRAADVIELPWELQQERKMLVLARKSSVPLLLWAHP